jgi:hypothetical protein
LFIQRVVITVDVKNLAWTRLQFTAIPQTEETLQ